MHKAIRLTALLLSVGAAACRVQPSTVVLQGTPGDIASFAGEWKGEYTSRESGRSGSIAFTVTAGTDTAFGDVVMTPTMGEPVIAADARTSAHERHARMPQVLRAEFVRLDGRLLRGELEPYIAPDCECVVRTIFRGVLEGDRVEGEYVTRSDGGLQQEGRWYVTRRRQAP